MTTKDKLAKLIAALQSAQYKLAHIGNGDHTALESAEEDAEAAAKVLRECGAEVLGE